MKRRKAFKSTLLGILGFMVFCGLWCALPAISDAAPGVVVYDRNKSRNVLAGRVESDRVLFSNGRSMKVGDIRKLQAAAKTLRTAKKGGTPFAFRHRPEATGTQVNNSADLAAALQRNKENETLQVGAHRITVEQLKFLRPELERRMGRKLDVSMQKPGVFAQRPNLTGRAETVHAKSDWKTLLNKSDDTVLESNGKNKKRITVGMLKQVLAQKPEAIPDFVRKAYSPAPTSQPNPIRGR